MDFNIIRHKRSPKEVEVTYETGRAKIKVTRTQQFVTGQPSSLTKGVLITLYKKFFFYILPNRKQLKKTMSYESNNWISV